MFKVHSQWGRLVARALSVVLAASLLAAIVGVASAQNPAKPAPTRQDGDGANPPLKASPGLILSLSYSPDGELIASGGADGKVRLFDAGTGVEIRTILEHDGPAAGVAYSPNGELVLSGGRDGGYRQTSVEGSNRFGSLNSDNQEAVTSVASSPNGLSFATSSGDQISLWGPGVGVRHTLRGHADMVTSVAYSPDCSRIVSGSRDKSVRVWDVTSRQTVLTLVGHRGPVTCVAYSPDGKWIVSGSSDKTVKLWDAKTGIETRTLTGHEEGVNSVAIRGDGKLIASGGDDHVVMLWDIEGDRKPQKFVGHTGAVIAVAFSPDGTRVVSSGKDERAQVWDARTLRPLVSLGSQDLPVGTANPSRKPVVGETLRGSPKAPQVPVGSNDSGSNDQPLLTIEIPASLAAFPVWSGDSQRIVAAPGSYTTKEGEVRVWNAEDGTEIVPPKRFAGEFREAVISPDGQRVVSFSWNNDRGTVTAWDIDTTTQLFRFPLERDERLRFGSVVFSPDGRRFTFGSYDPHVRVFDASTGTRGLALRSGVRGPAAESVVFSPDGKRIAAGSFGTLRIWDAETGKELLAIPRNEDWTEIPSLTFSPDGKRIAAAQSDRSTHTGEIQVWDAAQGTEIMTIEGHKKEVQSVAFSPDGRLIASGSQDHTIRLWDAASGAQLRRYKLSGGSKDKRIDREIRVVFSPDGKRLAGSVRSSNSTIRIWDVSAVAPQPNFQPKANAASDTPRVEEAPRPRGPAQRQALPGGSRSVRIKGRNIVSEAAPVLSVKSNLCAFNTLAYSHDGQRIATASNQTVTIWDAQTWAEIDTFIGHDGYVGQLAFRPDGKRLVSGGRDATLKIWDTEKGTEIVTLRGHVADVLCLAVSPDGQRIASAGKDNSIRLWDLDQGTQLSVLNGHKYWINSLAFSPDGRCLASGSGAIDSEAPAQLKIWDVDNSQQLLGLELPRGGVTSVSFSPDGNQIAAASGHRNPDGSDAYGEARVWDAETGIELLSLIEDGTVPVGCVAYSPDGRWIVTDSAGEDGSIRFWDAEIGIERYRIRPFATSNLVFNPDGKHITAWNNVDIKIWDASEPSLAGTRVEPIMPPAAVRVRPVEVARPAPPEAPGARKKGHAGSVMAIAYSSDGKRFVSGSDDQSVKVWDAATGEEVATFKGHKSPVMCVALSPDGKRGISGSYQSTAIVWDVATGQEVFPLKKELRAAVFSPDGKRIAGGSGNNVILWDAATGQQIQVFEGHLNAVCGVAYSPNGKRIVSGGWDNLVKVWDAETGKAIHTFEGQASKYGGVAFSSDSQRVVSSGSKDDVFKVWNAESGEEILTRVDPASRVNSVAFSPDGQRIVTGSSDRTVRIWDAKTGNPLRTLIGHGATVWNAVYSPDGKHILSCGDDRTVRVWNAETGEIQLTLGSPARAGGQPQVVEFEINNGNVRVPARQGAPGGNANVRPPLDGGAGNAGLRVFGVAGDRQPDGNIRYVNAPDLELVGRPLMTLKGHVGPVNAVASSPDGRFIVSGSGYPENWLRVWDAATGRLVRILKGHTAPVTKLAFTSNSMRVVSASYDAPLIVWDVDSGKELLRIDGQVKYNSGQAFDVSRDGRFIASGGTSPGIPIKLWDAVSGKEIRTIDATAIGLALSPDSKRLAFVKGDTITLLDLHDDAKTLILKGHHFPVESVAFSPDGTLLASWGGVDVSKFVELMLWDVASGQPIRSFTGHTDLVAGAAFSPDGKKIVSGGRDRTLKVWEVETGRELLSFKAHDRLGQNRMGVNSVAFNADGRRLLSSGDKEVKVWDAVEVMLVPVPSEHAKRAAPQLRPLVPGHRGDVNSVAFSPDGQRVVSGGNDGTVRVWDAPSGNEVFTLKAHGPGIGAGVTQVAFSPKGDRIVSSGDSTVKLWNADTGELQKTIHGHTGRVTSAAFSPDGKKIVSVSSQPENTMRVWDAATGQELFARKFEEFGRGAGVAFSPDGTQIVCVHESQTTLFDSTTGAPIRDVSLRGDRSTKAIFSPDGRRVLSPLKVADVATGEVILSLKTHTGADATSNAVYSPDGKTIACGDVSGTLLVWDADSGKQLAKILGNPDAILGVAFSPDGRFLVTGCAQPPTPPGFSQIKLWNVATGEEVRTFVGRPDLKEPAAGGQGGPRAPARGGPGAQRPGVEKYAAERVARAAVTQGDWKGAAQGYVRMFEIQPIDNGELGFESAAVLLLAGDKKGYQQRCAELLEKCGTDVIDVQERDNRLCELVDGVLVEKPMGFRESILAAALAQFLREFVVPRDLGHVSGADGMVRLAPGLVRIPDAAYFAWQSFPDEQLPSEAIPDLVPDLAVEVLSGSNTPGEMQRKLKEYFCSGVSLVWVVSPDERTVTVHNSEAETRLLRENDTLDGGHLLPGFQLPLSRLFSELDRKAIS